MADAAVEHKSEYKCAGGYDANKPGTLGGRVYLQ